MDLVLDLPDPFRETVVLRFFEDLAPKEIGERRGMPASTVRSRLTRALAMLRGRLDEEHGGDRRAWCVALLPLLSGRPTAGTVGTTALVSGGAVLMGTKLTILGAALVLLVTLAGLGALLGIRGGDEPPLPSEAEPRALELATPALFGDAPLYRSGRSPEIPSGDASGKPWSEGLSADAQARALFDAAIEEVLPLLRDLLASDPDRLVRKHAAVGLGRLGDDESLRALEAALQGETDPEVRAWAALATGRAGKGIDGGAPALHWAMSSDAEGLVRAAAARGLGRAPGEGVDAALAEAFRRERNALARIGAVAGLVGGRGGYAARGGGGLAVPGGHGHRERGRRGALLQRLDPPAPLRLRGAGRRPPRA